MYNVICYWYIYSFTYRFRPCLNTTELIISYLKQDILDSMLDSETKHEMSFTCSEMYRWIQYDFLCCCCSCCLCFTRSYNSTLSQSRKKEHLPWQPIEIGIEVKEKKRTTTVHNWEKIVYVYLVLVPCVFCCVTLNLVCRRFLLVCCCLLNRTNHLQCFFFHCFLLSLFLFSFHFSL